MVAFVLLLVVPGVLALIGLLRPDDSADEPFTGCPTQESGVTVTGCLEFTFSPTGPWRWHVAPCSWLPGLSHRPQPPLDLWPKSSARP
jgi:hypothetical protein